MTALKMTKIIGFLCIVYVFCGMFLRGFYTVLIGLFILLPLTLYDRFIIKKEEEKTQNVLKQNNAVCGFIGICYQGNDEIQQNNICELLFKRKEIIIFNRINEKTTNEIIINKKKIIDVKMLSLYEVKEISQTQRYDSLGKLGEYFYRNIDNKKIANKTKKDKTINYLFIHYYDKDNKIKIISIAEDMKFKDYNRRAQLIMPIDKFCKENY